MQNAVVFSLDDLPELGHLAVGRLDGLELAAFRRQGRADIPQPVQHLPLVLLQYHRLVVSACAQNEKKKR